MKVQTKEHTYLGIDMKSITIEFRKKSFDAAINEATKLAKQYDKYFVGWKRGSDMVDNTNFINDNTYIGISVSNLLNDIDKIPTTDKPLILREKKYLRDSLPFETNYNQSIQISNTGKMWSVYIHVRDIKKQ